MRRYGLLALLASLFVLTPRFAAEEGGGAGGDPAEPVAGDPGGEPSGDDFVQIPRSEYDEIINSVQQTQQERAVTSAVEEIQSKAGMENFDIKAVHKYLVELNKTEPERAKQLNNPVGWELVHTKELAHKPPDADPVAAGRNVEADKGRKDILTRVKSGEATIEERSSLWEKYL